MNAAAASRAVMTSQNDAATMAGFANGALGGTTNPLQSASMINSSGASSLLHQIQSMDAGDSRKKQALLDLLIENQQQQNQKTNGGHMNRRDMN